MHHLVNESTALSPHSTLAYLAMWERYRWEVIMCIRNGIQGDALLRLTHSLLLRKCLEDCNYSLVSWNSANVPLADVH